MNRQPINQLHTSPLLAIVQVRLNRQNGVTLNSFKEHILDMPEVALCLQIAGAFDFLLHVSVCDMHDFQVFLATKLNPCLVVSQTDVSIVLSVCKCFNKELIA